MSQLELESLLHYEHNLATCYEAEYLLELSMRREHISEEAATSWRAYEDSSEVRDTTYRPSPSFPQDDAGMEEMETANTPCGTTVATSRPNPLNSSSLFANCSPHLHGNSLPLITSGATSNHQSTWQMAPPSISSDTASVGVVCGKRQMVEDLEPQRKKMCLQRPEL